MRRPARPVAAGAALHESRSPHTSVPPCAPLREESDVSEAVSAGRGLNTKESDHRLPGGSACPPLGGSVWVTLLAQDG